MLFCGNVNPTVLTGEKITELSWKKSLAKLCPAKNKGETPHAAETESFCVVGNCPKFFCAIGEVVLFDVLDEIDKLNQKFSSKRDLVNVEKVVDRRVEGDEKDFIVY